MPVRRHPRGLVRLGRTRDQATFQGSWPGYAVVHGSCRASGGQVTASAAALSAARLRNLASGHLGTACREYRIPAGASRYIDRLTEPGWTCYALIINAPGESTSQGCQRRCHAGVSIQDPSTGPSGMTRPARNGRRRSRRRSWPAWASPGRVGESAGTAWLPPVSKPSVRRSGYTHRSFRPDNQRVDAPQRHGVHVHEVSCEDAVGLRGQELPPLRHEVARGE